MQITYQTSENISFETTKEQYSWEEWIHLF